MYSKFYRMIRFSIMLITRMRCAISGVRYSLEPTILMGDALLHRLAFFWNSPLMRFSFSKTLSCRLYELEFKTPLVISAFKDDEVALAFWMRLGMGSPIFKTVLSAPRLGNAVPRIHEICIEGRPGLINAMGLPGKGIDSVLVRLKQFACQHQGVPIGISIGGHSLDEYRHVTQKIVSFLDSESVPVYLEFNISCPNTHEGQDMLKHPHLLSELLSYTREITSAVIGVKVSPDLSDAALLALSDRIASVDRTYINCGNTRYCRPEEVGLAVGDLSTLGGGVSGPSLFPRTVSMVRLIHARHPNLPIMATGGISTYRDVQAVLDEGATLVGMATQLVVDPFQIPVILSQMSRSPVLNPVLE